MSPLRASSRSLGARWTLPFLAVLLGGLLACGKQGEGERCDTRNGSLDCDVGLVCRVGSELSLSGDTTGVGLCCPQEGIEPNVDECRAGAAQPPPEEDAGTDPQPPSTAGDAG